MVVIHNEFTTSQTYSHRIRKMLMSFIYGKTGGTTSSYMDCFGPVEDVDGSPTDWSTGKLSGQMP